MSERDIKMKMPYSKPVKHIAVTGGAGQIAYQLLFRIASGEMFGQDQPIHLHILELSEALKPLEGVAMELDDCAFPLLSGIEVGSDPMKIFKGAHYALLIGSKPRGPGMERSQLLNDNGKIFVEQGHALNEVADKHVKVLVVGNPCNTNCLIALSNAPTLSPLQFHAMTHLDQNRAVGHLAAKANVGVADVSHVTIWGNHSSTQVPDFVNATIRGRPVQEIIKDQQWLENEFITAIQKRGAKVIEARGKSSAASAAHAIIGAVRDITTPTPAGGWYSSAVWSTPNPYGIAPGLVFSFPCRTKSDGQWEIVPGLSRNEFLVQKIKATEKELLEERELVKDKLNRP